MFRVATICHAACAVLSGSEPRATRVMRAHRRSCTVRALECLFYHAAAQPFVTRAVIAELISGYWPRSIVWPMLRPFPSRNAEIVAQRIRNRRSPCPINRGVGVRSPPYAPFIFFLASAPFRLRRALCPHAVPLDAEHRRRDERLAVAQSLQRRHRIAGSPRRHCTPVSFSSLYLPVNPSGCFHCSSQVLPCSCLDVFCDAWIW